MQECRVLHIYGQGSFHDELAVMGNEAALQALAETIKKALTNGIATMDAFVSDGEGYTVRIKCLRGDWDTYEWQNLAVPYTADYASEKRPGAIYPDDLLSSRE